MEDEEEDDEDDVWDEATLMLRIDDAIRNRIMMEEKVEIEERRSNDEETVCTGDEK